MFRFTTPGDYTVWVRRWAGDSGANSAFVGLDGRVVGRLLDNTRRGFGQWTWIRHSTRVRISAGLHTIHVRRREVGYRVDQILLSRDSGFTPGAPAGGAQTPVPIQAEAMTLSSGYERDPQNSRLIRLKSAGQPATATAAFSGSRGTYSVAIRVLEEPDGAPRLELHVDGVRVHTVSYRQKATPALRWIRCPQTVALRLGSTIELVGHGDGGARARVDRLLLIPQVGSGR